VPRHVIFLNRKQRLPRSAPFIEVKRSVRKSLAEGVTHSATVACYMLESCCRRNGYSLKETTPFLLVAEKSMSTVGAGRVYRIWSHPDFVLEASIFTRSDGMTDASIRVLDSGDMR
jgi:hypothetical protein